MEAVEASAPRPAAGALVPDRPGYRSFQLEGCEFLVAESADGKLDLRDVYVQRLASSDDSSEGSDGSDAAASGDAALGYRRPEGALDCLPAELRAYHAVEHYTQFTGDVFQEQEAKKWLWRYYLVPIAARQPMFELDLEGGEVYVLDAKTASVRCCPVHRLAPPGTPPQELRLRIRDELVTLDTAESLPDWEDAVQARLAGIPSVSALEMARMEEYERAVEAALQRGAINQEEFDQAMEASWVATMLAGGEGMDALGRVPLDFLEQADVPGGLATTSRRDEEEEKDVMGGWEPELFEDLMDPYDDEADDTEEADYDDFDAPATDY